MSTNLEPLLNELDKRVNAVQPTNIDEMLNKLITIIQTIKSPDIKNATKKMTDIRKKTSKMQKELIKAAQRLQTIDRADELFKKRTVKPSLTDVQGWAEMHGEAIKMRQSIEFTAEDKALVLKTLAELNKIISSLSEIQENVKMHDYKPFTNAAKTLEEYLKDIKNILGTTGLNPLARLIRSLRSRINL